MSTSGYTRYPNTSSSGVMTYATFSDFPLSAADGTLALALDTDTLYAYSLANTAWLAIGAPGLALAIGTIDGVAASANGAVLSTDQLHMQSASVNYPGLVNLTTQSFAGNKTFTGTITTTASGTNTAPAISYNYGGGVIGFGTDGGKPGIMGAGGIDFLLFNTGNGTVSVGLGPLAIAQTGSASFPAFYLTGGDYQTGLYHVGAGSWGFSSAGSLVTTLNASGIITPAIFGTAQSGGSSGSILLQTSQAASTFADGVITLDADSANSGAILVVGGMQSSGGAGNITITSGTGAAGKAGGDITLQAGAGGTGDSDNGGNVAIYTGAAGSGASSGGAFTIETGSGSAYDYPSDGGAMSFITGNGARGPAGDIAFTTGSGGSNRGGNFGITLGNGGTGTGGNNGGAFTLVTGTGGAGGGNYGGALTFTAGDSGTTGGGGAITFNTGNSLGGTNIGGDFTVNTGAGSAARAGQVNLNSAVVLGAASTTLQHAINTAVATPASGALTTLNGPTGASGDPAVYIQITINGTTYVMPAWAV